MNSFRSLFKNRNFLLLWLGQLISNFGDRLNQMALVALVYQRTPGSEMALAKLIAFTIIPVFFIGPIAGVWVDRSDKKRLMVIADIIRGSLVLMIPICIAIHQIVPIYVIIFLSFSVSRFFIPSKMAIVPDIVDKDKLLQANSLTGLTHMIGNVIGLVVAGIIVNIPSVGAIGGFFIDGVTFFISALLIGFIVQKGFSSQLNKDLHEVEEAVKKSARSSVFQEMLDGARAILKSGNMRFVASAFFLFLAGIGAISCVIIIFVQEAFGSATRDLGLIGMFLVAGLFVGTVVFGKFGANVDKRRAVLVSFIASGFTIMAFAMVLAYMPRLYLAFPAAALVGFSVSPIMISMNTLTQETVPDAMRGRIFSAIEVIIHMAFLISMFAAASLATLIGRFAVIVSIGMLFVFLGGLRLVIEMRRKAT